MKRNPNCFERGRTTFAKNPALDFLGTGRAVRALFGKTGQHQLVDIIGDIILDAEFRQPLFHGSGRAIHHLCIDVAGMKRRLARHQIVERGAERINVIGGTRHFAVHLLWAHEQNRAAHRVFHG